MIHGPRSECRATESASQMGRNSCARRHSRRRRRRRRRFTLTRPRTRGTRKRSTVCTDQRMGCLRVLVNCAVDQSHPEDPGSSLQRHTALGHLAVDHGQWPVRLPDVVLTILRVGPRSHKDDKESLSRAHRKIVCDLSHCHITYSYRTQQLPPPYSRFPHQQTYHR